MAFKRYARRSARRYTPRSYNRSYSSYRRPTRKRVTRKRATAMKSKCECPVALTPGQKFAMAQLDPFDVIVNGAKIPDSNTQPSIANTDMELVTLSSGLAGTLAGIAFRPFYTWGTITPPTASPIVWGAFATNATNRSKRTNWASAMELSRPVAHAIRISSPLAPTSASGFVHIAISTESLYNVSSWQFPTTVAEISNLQFYKRVTVASLTQSPLTVINKWIDDTAFRYSNSTAPPDSAGPQSFQTDYSWGTIVVIVEAAPVSTQVLSFEHLLLSEGIPDKNAVLIGSPAASNSPETLSAVSHMATTQEPFHNEAEQESYIQRGVNAIVEGAAAQGEATFQHIGVPLARAAGGFAARTAINYGLMAVAGVAGIAGVNNNPNRLGLTR